MIFIMLPLTLMAADLAIKYHINRNRGRLEGKVLPGGIARLHLMHNRGFAGNRLEDHPKLVIGVSSASLLLFAAAFISILRMRGQVILKACLAAALGGALGNTVERLAKGSVTDYLQILRRKRTGKYVYNFADICIFIGSAAGIAILVKDLLSELKK